MADADDLSAICVLCKFDIETLDNGVLKKLELKSYSVGTIGNMSNSPQFKNQFKAYLVEANGISDFEYIFNGMKTQDITFIKEKFQTIFQQNNFGLYDEILSTKPNTTLFSSMGITTKGEFIQAVNSLDHDIYNFLNIL